MLTPPGLGRWGWGAGAGVCFTLPHASRRVRGLADPSLGSRGSQVGSQERPVFRMNGLPLPRDPCFLQRAGRAWRRQRGHQRCRPLAPNSDGLCHAGGNGPRAVGDTPSLGARGSGWGHLGPRRRSCPVSRPGTPRWRLAGSDARAWEEVADVFWNGLSARTASTRVYGELRADAVIYREKHPGKGEAIWF